MKATRLALSAAMLLGTTALLGCASDSNQKSLPQGENGRTAGGNGAFGENPDRPGEYNAPNGHASDTSHAPALGGNSAADGTNVTK